MKHSPTDAQHPDRKTLGQETEAGTENAPSAKRGSAERQVQADPVKPPGPSPDADGGQPVDELDLDGDGARRG